MDQSSIDRDGGNGGRMGRRRPKDDSDCKSPNLHAERRRRQKLRDRLLKLRALVPIITNMNKATIIEDAITYIEELKEKVDTLTNKLSDNRKFLKEEAEPSIEETHAAEQGIKKFEIQEEVNVSRIGGNKLWMRMIFEKKRGRFTKFLEATSALGLELTDTTVTTSKGAMLVTSSVEGFCCEKLALDEAKKLLLQIINGI